MNVNVKYTWTRWVMTGAGFLGCLLFVLYGIQMQLFTSQEALTAFLAAAGILAPLIFIVIQAIQVVVPIIPGGVSCLGGVLIFGPVLGFVYNYMGICIGSVCAFLIARSCGPGILQKVAGAKTYDKYVGWLDEKGRFDKLFTLAIFFPVAPDDFLCYLAGVTKMTLRKFVLIILLGKPASIALYSLGLSIAYQQLQGLF